MIFRQNVDDDFNWMAPAHTMHGRYTICRLQAAQIDMCYDIDWYSTVSPYRCTSVRVCYCAERPQTTLQIVLLECGFLLPHDALNVVWALHTLH